MYKSSLHFQFHIISVLLFLFFTCGISLKRKIEYHVNPGCNIPQCKSPASNESYINLIHVSAMGPNDTIHYLWSTYMLPSVIIARTTNNAALEINWTEFQNLTNGALWFTENPKQSTALILNKLWAYADEEDTVNIPDSNDTTSLNLTEFRWDSISSDIHSSETLLTAIVSASNEDFIFSHNGSFVIQFSVSAVAEASDIAPHLHFNSNSTQMNILFDNLATTEKERFAAEFIAVSSSASQGEWSHASVSSINDEYSPGVFSIHELFPPNEKDEDRRSYLSWKPVSYVSDKTTVANTSDAIISGLTQAEFIPPSLVSMYYENTSHVTKVTWNMTFGTSGDGFYDHSKYSSWSVMIGTGHPVLEEMSLLAKVVIAIGLGAPLVIMLGGGVFLTYKKCRKEDDDLLLDE